MRPEKLLIDGLSEIGLHCSKTQISAFMSFLSELKKWNRAYNLTALKTDEKIVIKHFIDSLLYLKAMEFYTHEKQENFNRIKIADAGTGAGFPGIPIKIVKPETDITLIESSGKKTVFLRHIAKTLNLDKVTVLNKRFEALDKKYENSFDILVSRATFKIKSFLSIACPYIKEGGILVLSKGPGVNEEIKELKDRKAIKKILKFHLYKSIDTAHSMGERHLLILGCKHQ